jgi:hypothetical protein
MFPWPSRTNKGVFVGCATKFCQCAQVRGVCAETEIQNHYLSWLPMAQWLDTWYSSTRSSTAVTRCRKERVAEMFVSRAQNAKNEKARTHAAEAKPATILAVSHTAVIFACIGRSALSLLRALPKPPDLLAVSSMAFGLWSGGLQGGGSDIAMRKKVISTMPLNQCAL